MEKHKTTNNAGTEAELEATIGASSVLGRRKFVTGALGAAAAGMAFAACGSSGDSGEESSSDSGKAASETTGDADLDEALQASDLPELKWDMATSWPIALDTIYGGAVFFCEQVSKLTGGRFQITPAPGGELVPALEVLQSVQTQAVNAGHSAAYYYVGLDPIAQISTCLPFGMTARQHQSWLIEGGGQQLLQDAFREKFGVVQFAAGNTGCQMGGWFNKEIKSLADIGGLRMRIPGMGGQVMSQLGASVQVIPGGEIYQSLETGAIDAAEWVGPYDDLKQEFNKVTKFYYYPGWWEPGPSLDVMFPADEFDGLPEEYQAVIQAAAAYSYNQMLARYDALNPPALAEIKAGGTITLPFPDDFLNAAAEATHEMTQENAANDATYKTVLESYESFRDGIGPWHGLAEKAMLDFLAQ